MGYMNYSSSFGSRSAVLDGAFKALAGGSPPAKDKDSWDNGGSRMFGTSNLVARERRGKRTPIVKLGSGLLD